MGTCVNPDYKRAGYGYTETGGCEHIEFKLGDKTIRKACGNCIYWVME